MNNVIETILRRIKSIGGQPPFRLAIQSDETECGLASLAMIMRTLGCQCDLEHLRKRYGSTRGGMTVGELCNFATTLGLRGIPARVKADELVKTPSIIFSKNEHFSVLWKIQKKEGTKYYVADPSDGILCFMDAEIKDYYSGIQIYFRPIKKVFAEQSLTLSEDINSLSLFSLLIKRSVIVGLICMLAAISSILALMNAAAQDVFMTYVVEEGEVLWIKGLIVITIVLSGLVALSGLMMQIAVQRQLQDVIQKWNINLFNSLFKAPYSFFINKTTGLISSRFSQVEEALSGYQSAVLSAFTGSLNLLVFVIAVMLVSPPLGLVSAIGIAAFIYVGITFYGYNIQNNYMIREAECLAATAEFKLIKGREQIILEHSVDAILRELAGGYTSLAKAELSTSRVGAISEFFLGSIDQVLNALLLVVSSILIVNGNLTTGTYAAINVIIGTALEPIRSLSQLLETLQNSKLTFQSASELLPSTDILKREDKDSAMFVTKYSQDDPTIQLVNISFQYSKYSDPILKNANLTIKSKSGRPVAVRLDGKSGSGKSTLMNLMLGLINPTEGQVLIGGVNLKGLRLSELRKIVQYVDRSALIALGTVQTNACLGTNANREEYERVLNILGLSQELIFSQQSSRILQNETSISIGQGVMISLVRAALSKPKLLMIDESLVSIPEKLHKTVIQGFLKLNINVLIVQHGESRFINTLPSISMQDLTKGANK